MKLYKDFYINKKRTGEIVTNAPDGKERNLVGTPMQWEAIRLMYTLRSRKYVNEATKTARAMEFVGKLASSLGLETAVSKEEKDEEARAKEAMEKQALRKDVTQKLMNFFSEFEFEPSYRFLNSLANAKDKKAYVANYFELSGNPYTNSVIEKMRSMEFANILKDIDNMGTQGVTNKRFKLYYGSQGTGKTTLAMKEAEGNVMVCHNGIQPDALMKDFDFVDGKATFKHGALWKAMEEGKKIVLDEINLLPFESVRFLQTILDNKEEFMYDGETIHIKDGFQIIGTMNLVINGATYQLPDPLVDRGMELRKFKLTADDLADAFI